MLESSVSIASLLLNGSLVALATVVFIVTWIEN